MIPGYEYEDWLLEQWSIWSRSESVVIGFHHGGTGIGLADGIRDDDMMVVDSCVAKLQKSDSRVIKGYYWRKEYDEYQDQIKSAVRQFSNLLEEARTRQ